MHKVFIVTAMTLGLGLLGSPLVSAEDLKNPPQDKAAEFSRRAENRQKITQEIYAQLNLTEQQKNSLEANKAQHRVATKTIRDQARALRTAMDLELMKADYDMIKLQELQRQIKGVQDQMADLRFESILAVREILSPEQFAKFIELTSQMHKPGPGEEDAK